MQSRFNRFMFKGYRSCLWMGLGFCIGVFLSLRGGQLYLQAIDLKKARELVYLEGIRLQTISPSLNEANKHKQEAHLAVLEAWLKTYQPKGMYAFWSEVKQEPSLWELGEFSDDLRARLKGSGLILDTRMELNLEGLATEEGLRRVQEDALSYLGQCLLQARPQSLLGLKVYTEKDRPQEGFLSGILFKENGCLEKSYVLYCRVGFLGYTESLRVLLELLNGGPYAFILDRVSARAREGAIKQEHGFVECTPGTVEFTLEIAVVKHRWREGIES